MPKRKKLDNSTIKGTQYVKHITILATYLLVVWGFYRFLFRLPDEIEEVLIKPLVWLIPVYYFVKKERAGIGSLGITSKKLFMSLYLALALGMVFAIEGFLINYVKYGNLTFTANLGTHSLLIALGISFATAVSEEITFRGYIFNRLLGVLQKEWLANLITSVVWGIVHVPIAIFAWNLDVSSAFGFLILTTIFSIGSSFVFARTKNVASSVFLHVFWEWPIILFR